MTYKKIDLPADAVPVYEVGQIFSTVQSLGYTIHNLIFNENSPGEDEFLIRTIEFDIKGLPVPRVYNDQVMIETGEARVIIYTNETVNEGNYYVQDIVMSSFKLENDLTTILPTSFPQHFKSFALDMLFHSLIKTVILLKNETVPVKNEEELPESGYNA